MPDLSRSNCCQTSVKFVQVFRSFLSFLKQLNFFFDDVGDKSTFKLTVVGLAPAEIYSVHHTGRFPL